MTSISLLKKEKKKAEFKHDYYSIANFCALLGAELQEKFEYESALDEYNEELRIFEKLKDLKGIAVAHRRIGEVYTDMKQWNEALEHQEKFLSLAKKSQDFVLQQRAYATLGRTHYQFAESVNLEDGSKEEQEEALHKSENSFKLALRICDKLNDKVDGIEASQMRCRVYHNLGLVVDMKDEPSSAINFINQALQLCLHYNLEEDAYRAYSELSRIHLRMGLKDKALEEAKKSLNVAQKMHRKNFIVDSYIFIGYINLILDDYIGARKFYYKAYKTKYTAAGEQETVVENLKTIVNICIHRDFLSSPDSIDDEEIIKTYEKLGDCYVNLKVGPGLYDHYDHAIKFYKKTLDKSFECQKDQKYLAVIYTSLARTYADKKMFKEALNYYKKEHEVQTVPKEIIMTLSEMGKMSYRLLDEEQAVSYFEKAFILAEKIMDQKLKMYVIRSHSEYVSSPDKQKLLDKQLQNLSDTYGIDIDFELSDDEQTEGDDIDLDLIDFSDSDDEYQPKVPGSRLSRGLKIKRTNTGDTPLHLAAIHNKVAQVKRLLQQKHSVNLRDNSGWLPIHEACNYGHVEIVELLIEAGAFVNDKGGRECSGITPMHDAASNGHVKVIEILLKNGASALSRDDKGLTPLEYLIKYSSDNNLSNDELQECINMQNILLGSMEKAGYQVPERVKQKVAAVLHNQQSVSNLPSESENDNFDLPDFSDMINDISDPFEQEQGEDSVEHIQGTPPFITLNAKINTNSATDSYRNAIKNIGSHSKNVEIDNAASCIVSKTSDQGPLIPEEKYIEGDSDWLIDDLVVLSKKRKRHENYEFNYKEMNPLTSPANTNATSTRKNKQPKITPMLRKKSPSYLPNDLNDSITEVDNLFSENNKDHINERLPETHPKVLYKRSKVPSPKSVFTPSSNHKNLMILPPHLKLNVKVFNTKLLVPIATSAQNYTIGWLEDEVSRRYLQHAGIKLKMKLITSKEEILNPDDLICMTLSADNCELLATNIEVRELPPLPERYAEACKELCLPEYAEIIKCLRKAESSSILDLSRSFLRLEKEFKPIVKSLQHQNLQIIILNSCRIGDVCFMLLIESMSSLIMLQKLEAKACSLTFDSLEKLCEVVTKVPNTVKKLIDLDLSYNDFSEANFSAIKSLLSFPSLKYLYLQSCNLFLTSQSAVAFTSPLHTLNLDDNEISLGCFSSLLNYCSQLSYLSIIGSLPQSSQIIKIGRSSSPVFGTSKREPCIGDSLSSLMGIGTACPLEHLDISMCGVRNEDLNILSQYLYRCPLLNFLNVSNNSHLSEWSVMKLLQEILDNPKIPLKTLLLHGINSIAESEPVISLLEKVIERKGMTVHPITAFSLPASTKTTLISQKWKENYNDKALVTNLCNQMFMNLQL